ncbi:MAG: threonine synthase, partial [Proteobacteria bacterium]|nr:threonine synthase [Pseudomonadota bacterium]
AAKLGAPETTVSFAVPTGNFGNVFAGYAARRLGLPVDQFVVGSNRNDILTRFFASGSMEKGEVHSTISPSMDIQVSSNFERLLFELEGRDGGRVASIMAGLGDSGRFAVDAGTLKAAQALFEGASFDDQETKATIKAVFDATGELVDPHTAVGIAAARARRRDPDRPMIALATAHPAKFPDAVEDATGVRPDLPERLSNLLELEERCQVLANDLSAVQAHVSEHARARVAA